MTYKDVLTVLVRDYKDKEQFVNCLTEFCPVEIALPGFRGCPEGRDCDRCWTTDIPGLQLPKMEGGDAETT